MQGEVRVRLLSRQDGGLFLYGGAKRIEDAAVEREREGGVAWLGPLKPHGTAVVLEDTARDRESEPDAAVLAFAHKWLEERIANAGRNAGTSVDNA